MLLTFLTWFVVITCFIPWAFMIAVILFNILVIIPCDYVLNLLFGVRGGVKRTNI